jgi:hypothetical protein
MSSNLKLIVSVCLALAVNLGSTARCQQQNTSELSLTSRQKAIVPISAYAAKGDQLSAR